MSETYAALINDWRKASEATRNAQAKLKAQFDAHLGGGPEPHEEDVRRLRELREIESRKLDEAMQYVKKTARGPRTGMGKLD
jgi:hypothetical protein